MSALVRSRRAAIDDADSPLDPILPDPVRLYEELGPAVLTSSDRILLLREDKAECTTSSGSTLGKSSMAPSALSMTTSYQL